MSYQSFYIERVNAAKIIQKWYRIIQLKTRNKKLLINTVKRCFGLARTTVLEQEYGVSTWKEANKIIFKDLIKSHHCGDDYFND